MRASARRNRAWRARADAPCGRTSRVASIVRHRTTDPGPGTWDQGLRTDSGRGTRDQGSETDVYGRVPSPWSHVPSRPGSKSTSVSTDDPQLDDRPAVRIRCRLA